MFTLDFPSYQPVLTHAKNRTLREEMYRAFVTRASSGELNNEPIIDKVRLPACLPAPYTPSLCLSINNLASPGKLNNERR